MWATLALIVVALVMYALERTPIEVTSLSVIGALLGFFHFFPIAGADGQNMLDAERLLAGFGNPALLTVLGLLVIGQAMVRTGVLDRAAHFAYALGGGSAMLTIALCLVVVMAFSAVLNNIPVVVIFIPILQTLAKRLDHSASHVMIPLSFAAVLGGMTTLIGSSTNLLVSSALIELNQQPFTFFEFTVPALVLAGVGLLYVMFVAPRLLPDRAGLAGALIGGGGKQFIAQITVSADSKLVGETPRAGFFKSLPEMTVRMVVRDERAFVPPFEELALQPADILVVAATRNALTEAHKKDSGLLVPDLGEGPSEPTREQRREVGDRVLAEVMVAPASRMIGQSLLQIGFRHRYNCVVLGIQRRSRMIRAQLSDIRLLAGDVLLIQGRLEDVEAMRADRDLILLEWSAMEMPAPEMARLTTLIFLAVVVAAASEVVPTSIAALLGAAAMLLTGALNIRQAVRALDTSIIMTIAAAIALGISLEITGGAQFISQVLVRLFAGASPAIVLSVFFLIVALLANAINTKACAVLFTPIALQVALSLGVDPRAFAVAVVFAANCAFASPVAYQTNLLVMGPGHYKFVDFVRAGLPMIFVIWIAFSLFAPAYYGLQ